MVNRYKVDIAKPPAPPPPRMMRGAFLSFPTKESQQRTREWKQYIEDYGQQLRRKQTRSR